MQNNISSKNTDPKNQIILFSFCQRLTLLFCGYSRRQKINLVSPNVLFLELDLSAVLVSSEIETQNFIWLFFLVSE